MIVTGTIDRYASKWGVNVLPNKVGDSCGPVIDYRSPAISHYRRDQYWAKKLIFKKLCLQLEAVVDPDGVHASMNTNFVVPGELDVYAVGALANSALLSWIYEGYFGALRMSGGFMQVQAPQLRVLPMPELPVVSEQELEELVRGDHFAGSRLSPGLAIRTACAACTRCCGTPVRLRTEPRLR